MTYVERCLYEYKANVASIEAMKAEHDDLTSAHCQTYEGHTLNGVSDPVFEVTARKMGLESRIARTERKTRPVERLKADLTGNDLRIVQMREILNFKYINQEGNEKTQELMAVSSRTYWRRVRELLWLAKKYFGEVDGVKNKHNSYGD